MKQKDLIYLVVAVVILLVAGYIVYLNVMPKSSAAEGVKVDIVGTIDDKLDRDGLAQLTDTSKVKDFSSPVEFTGLNNPAPFGK